MQVKTLGEYSFSTKQIYLFAFERFFADALFS